MTATRDGGVVVIHPTKQHVYEVVRALHNAGLLREFLTSIYYKPSELPYSLVNAIPVVGRVLKRELSKRMRPGLPTDLIQTWPYAEVLSRTVGRTRVAQRLSNGSSGFPFVNWAFDRHVSNRLSYMKPRPAAVYGFLGASLRSFERARALRIPTILDVPIVLNADEIVVRERARLRLTEQRQPVLDMLRLRRELSVADWVIAPSEAVAQSVREVRFPHDRIVVIPFGADVDLFRPLPSRIARPFRVVFAGRIEVRKGVHHLLEGWRRAALDGELILAGSCEERSYGSYLRSKFAGSFVEAGNLTQQGLASLFANADVFVLPSLAEGSALVTYQALAAGLPSIVTHSTGSVVRNGIEGFIVPVRNSDAIANGLRLLFSNTSMRVAMSEAARRRGLEFAWNGYHERLVETIERIANIKPVIRNAPIDESIAARVGT